MNAPQRRISPNPHGYSSMVHNMIVNACDEYHMEAYKGNVHSEVGRVKGEREYHRVQ